MTSPDTTSASGVTRLFADQTYHFQTLRVLSDIPFGGADTGEVLATIGRIREGDVESWYGAWAETAEANARRAGAAHDPVSRGLANLRAHTDWRTSEFLLKPADPRRPAAWRAQVEAFDRGLMDLGIEHTRFDVSYEDAPLRAILYPGPAGWEARPLIVAVGGYDSTLEELYFVIAAAAHRRGYGVLTYEGPGQGAALREHGLHFTPEWERPNAAVLDAYLAAHPKPPCTILLGMSMGGYLAPRAAAFDDRIDGVVAYDVMFDMAQLAQRYQMAAAHPELSKSSGVVWAIENGCWTTGAKDLADLSAHFADYRLAPVADRITADVLILAGERDHFVPVEQAHAFEASLANARSVERVVYDAPSGGAEHCQLGAHTLWHETLFGWLARRFGEDMQRSSS